MPRTKIVLFISLLACFPMITAAYVNPPAQHAFCRGKVADILKTNRIAGEVIAAHTFSLQLPAAPPTCFFTLRETRTTHFILTTFAGQLLHRFTTPPALKNACEIQAVAFEDFNNDTFPEVIAINRCTATAGHFYYQNLLYWSQAHAHYQWQWDEKGSRDISLHPTYPQLRPLLRQAAQRAASPTIAFEPKPLQLTARLHQYPDGLVLIADEQPLTIYLLKQYPDYLDTQRARWLNNVYRIKGTQLRSYTRGELTYKDIVIEKLE